MLPPARIVYSLPVSLYKSLFFSYLIAMSFNFPNIIETVFCVQICVRPCWECKGEWYRVLYSQGSLSSVSVYVGGMVERAEGKQRQIYSQKTMT